MNYGEKSNEKKVTLGNKPFKKKGLKGGNDNKRYKVVPDVLKGIAFTITRDGPDLFFKAVKRLGVYLCVTNKNGSDLEMCLDAEQLILPEEPVLTQNPNAHQCKMWDLCAKAATNNEDKLRQT